MVVRPGSLPTYKQPLRHHRTHKPLLNSSTHSEAGLSREDLIALFLALAHALPTLPGLAERAGVPQR